MAASTAYKHLLIFGDQSVEKLTAIQTLVHSSKSHPAARRFLQEAIDVIQLELNRLGPEEHGWHGTLDSLLGLAEEYDSSNDDNIIVSTALACSGRLGQLISYAHEDPTTLGSALEPVDIIALCGGLLPAAVAVAAQDTSELFPLAREILSVGIRLASQVNRHMKLIDQSPESWGITYTGVSSFIVQSILDQFHNDQDVPEFRRTTIGVVAKDWLTLIGPPSSLKQLTSWSPEIRDASHIRTGVTGPIHTNHAPKIDIPKILGKSPLLRHPIDHAKVRMFSPSSCKQYCHDTLGDLLREILEDIAHNVLRVTDVVNTCVSTLDATKGVKLSVMGPTNHLAAVKMALQANEIEYQVRQPVMTSQNENSRGGSDLIAIVGMAGKFPGSDTVDGFWEDLMAGKCHIKEVPKSRFNLDSCYDSSGEEKNSTTAKHGAWIDNPGFFDHRLFNVSPREAAQLDPGHRQLLMVAYEALQSAGYSPNSSLANGSSRIASYFGQAADEWREILNQKGADIYYVPGFSRAFGVGRLNFHFNWSGGAVSLDTACSTSSTAVNLARSALIARECDMALAGGYSVINSPTVYSGLSRSGMLSTTDGCRTFHADADGYARAEGAGVVVLKRLEDAISDNDKILAVIRGSARMHSPTADSMTHPSAASQQMAYNEVLRQSALSADEIAYVEMHGTGTQAGDFEEMSSVVNTFATGRKRDNPLTVGAVKAAMGHGEGAAGVTSLIKTILMLRERAIPPQPGWPFTLNPNFPPLAQHNVKISTKTTTLKPSPKGDKKIKLLVNSFDASGGNTVIAIEEAPSRPSKRQDVRAWHTIAISGRTAKSLQGNRERLLDYLERYPDTKLADLAYTTTARRVHEQLRVAYSENSTKSLINHLRQDTAKQSNAPRTSLRPRKCVFLFTGQGSHYAGMGAQLFRECQQFREAIMSYQDMATIVGLPYFMDLISDPDADMSRQSTIKVQLALTALEIALAHLMKCYGVTPSLVIGHSLGEYAALCVAGVLSVSNTLLLVGKRAALMEKHLQANTHAMVVANMTEQQLEGVFSDLKVDSCQVACANAPSITVASGTTDDVAKVKAQVDGNGGKTTLLRVPYGFHSEQVEPILDEFRQICRRTTFLKPDIPIASTLSGKIETEANAFSNDYLTRQAREKVDFVGALRAIEAAGSYGDDSLWLEIGPEPVCVGLARNTLHISASQTLPSLKSGESNWKTLSSILKRAYESGISVNWAEIHRGFKDSLTLLDLPSYAFDCQDFWTPYVKPENVTETTQKSDLGPSIKSRQFLTNSIQHVEEEVVDGSSIKTVFVSDVSDPFLLKAIQGHAVLGHTICSLGIFHDMALTAAKHVYGKLHNHAQPPSMSIRDINITQALNIADTTPDSVIRVVSSHNVTENAAHIQFFSQTGDKTSTHGECRVVFEVDPLRSLDMSQSFLLKSRINSLQEQARSKGAHWLLKPIIYQLFSNVVEYSSTYQSLEDVTLDAACNDAIATVRVPEVSQLGKFHLSPYCADASVQLTGFILNSGLRYAKDVACLATGFDSWQSTKGLSAGQTYTVYACLHDIPNSHIVQGDCYVFQDDEIVQATRGIKFLKLNRVAAGALLGNTEAKQPQPNKTRLEPAHQANALSQPRGTPGEHKKTVADTPFTWSEPFGTTQKQTDVDAGASTVDIGRQIELMLSIVANEGGYDTNEMTDDTRYTDLGIDSVMAINILAKLASQADIQLPAAFFLENKTIGDSKQALRDLLGGEIEVSTSEAPEDQQTLPSTAPMSDTTLLSPLTSSSWSMLRQSSIATSNDVTLEEGDSLKIDEIVEAEDQSPPTHSESGLVCNAIQYQGGRSEGSKKLFFVADETGSTLEFIHLPKLDANVGVYGIESPLSGNVAGSEFTFEELTSAYRAAIQKEQPSGPYLLGGVSAGAVIAYEVARQLLKTGEKVQGLLILDCGSTKIDLERIQAADTDAAILSLARPDQKEHVQKVVSLCDSYRAVAFSQGDSPRFSVQVLAKDQVASSEWHDLVPGLLVQKSDIQSGSFLEFSSIALLGKIIRNLLNEMKEGQD